MKDYNLITNDFLEKKQKYYGKPINSFSKFLVKEFAGYLKTQLEAQEVVIDKKQPQTETETKKDTRLNIAIITEDTGHLTGGRYYCWFIASALVELDYNVTIYTNNLPKFGSEFLKYQKPKIVIASDKARGLENIDIEADIYIGSPISGNIASCRLGKKYNKPSYALIFDPFPLMEIYLGKHEYVGWKPLVKEMRESDVKIISLCKTTSEYIYNWLNKRPDDVIEINPCINSREFDIKIVDKQKYVVFMSRLVRHKNFEHVLYALKNSGYNLKVISSVDAINAKKLVEDMDMSGQVDFHIAIGDKEKFKIINKSSGVINSSLFEGFGMWAIEAFSAGVPLICYEYPTIREIEQISGADNFYFAKYNDKESLRTQFLKAMKQKKFNKHNSIFNFQSMIDRCKEVFTVEPKIGVITIALNESEFIYKSLSAVMKHPSVKKIAVVEGAVNLYSHASTKEGLSIDDTKDCVLEAMLNKQGNKIIYERYGWAIDKSELRNRALQLLGKGITHVLVVDADEVWKQEDITKLVDTMRENPSTGVFLFPFYHFWKNKKQIAVGGQWDAQMFRCFRYADKTLHWERHELPVVNKQNEFINKTDGSMEVDVHVYHYGYCKKGENVRAKLEYYKKRDKDLDVVDTWTNWKEGNPTQPTHGGGTVEKFKGVSPI
jgi:glycosyltransferase involved in cell wall biosynthesis